MDLSPEFISAIYKSITKTIIDDYKWLATLNRVEPKEFDKIGKNLFIEETVKKEPEPEKFDIRLLEARAKQFPNVAIYFRGKRLPNK